MKKAMKIALAIIFVFSLLIMDLPVTYTKSVNAEDQVRGVRGEHNLALNKPVTVSSVESDVHAAEHAVDGKSFTRWASERKDDEWIYVDLEERHPINQVVLNWEAAYGKSYKIQVSNDAKTWKDVKVETNGNGGIDQIAFPTVEAQYVRMYGVERATKYAFSLFEFEVYADDSISKNKEVTASSYKETEIIKNSASLAVDANPQSYWQSEPGSDEWLLVELERSMSIDQVYLSWGEFFPEKYKIQVSNDGDSWEDALEVTDGKSGINEHDFEPVTGKYIRILCMTGGEETGYTLKNVEVYGADFAYLQETTVSSTYATDVPKENAVDRNLNTKWASNRTDDEWIYVDLGEIKPISDVIIHWEGAYGKVYNIQVSDDAETWTDVLEVSDGKSGENIHSLPSGVQARYVRILGIERGTKYGYTIFSFEVYNAIPNQNLAQDQPVSASSEVTNTFNYQPSLAIDGNHNTFWQSETANDEWIYVDLEETQAINKVILDWGFDYAVNYKIEVSEDGSNWSEFAEVTDSDGGFDVILPESSQNGPRAIPGRYVRVSGEKSSLNEGFQLNEISVYGYDLKTYHEKLEEYQFGLESIDIIKQRLLEYSVAEGDDIVPDNTTDRVEWTYKSKSGEYLSNQLENGSWEDVEYSDRADVTWKPILHVDRLLAMAAAYNDPTTEFYQNDELKEGILKGIDYWYQASSTSVNWWWNEIGKQLRLRQIGLLMEDELNNDQKNNIIQDLDAVPTAGKDTNAIWYNSNLIFRGILENNIEKVENGSSAIEDALTITINTGIQPDYSFHIHGRQLYSNGYGKSFFMDTTFWATMFNETYFEYQKSRIDNLVDYMLDGSRWMIRGKAVDYNTTGRSLDDFQANVSSWASDYLPYLELLKEIAPERIEDINNLILNIKGERASSGLIGNKHFWRSDYMSHMRDGYFTSLSMVSNRTMGGEGGKSRWSPFGMTYIFQDGTEYKDIFFVWDNNKMPGVTNPYDPTTTDYTPGKSGNHQVYRHSSTFVGGVSNGMYGAAGFDFNKSDTVAKKGYFYFDDVFVALGAGINSTDEHNVITTLNQTLKNGVIKVDGEEINEVEGNYDGNWVYHGGVGYIFPEKTNFNISDKHLTNDELNLEKDVMTLWLDHGLHPSGESYEYFVAPGMTEEQVANYSKDNPIRIISNTESVQAVQDTSIGVTEAIFYEAGTLNITDGVTVSVDQPSMLVLEESGSKLKVSVANPDQADLTVNVKLDYKGTIETIPFELPSTEELKGQTVTKNIEIEEQVDKTDLEQVISNANRISDAGQQNYTDASWNELIAQLQHASTIMNDTDATQENVDHAKNLLQEAIDGLVESDPEVDPVDVKELEKLIEKAKGISNENGSYTTASYESLQDAITEAKSALAGIKTEEALTEAIAALQEAIDGLVESDPEVDPVDVKELEKLIEKAKGISNENGSYTTTSYESLQDAITEAKSTLAGIKTEEALTEAIAALQEAIDGLVESEPEVDLVDVIELEKLIEKAKGISNESGSYTTASYEALQAAITKAEIALANIETEVELSTAIKDLQTAINGLKTKDTVETPEVDDNGKEKEEEGATENPSEENDSSENKLPSTASGIYHSILLGAFLLLIGVMGFMLMNRRHNQLK